MSWDEATKGEQAWTFDVRLTTEETRPEVYRRVKRRRISTTNYPLPSTHSAAFNTTYQVQESVDALEIPRQRTPTKFPDTNLCLIGSKDTGSPSCSQPKSDKSSSGDQSHRCVADIS